MSPVERWERAWGSYVAALARLDRAGTRCERRGARLSAAKARKQCARLAPDLMARLGFDLVE